MIALPESPEMSSQMGLVFTASGKSRFYLNLLIVAYFPFKLDK